MLEELVEWREWVCCLLVLTPSYTNVGSRIPIPILSFLCPCRSLVERDFVRFGLVAFGIYIYIYWFLGKGRGGGISILWHTCWKSSTVDDSATDGYWNGNWVWRSSMFEMGCK